MTPDGLLTLVTVLLVAYQIIPRARLLDLQFRFGKTTHVVTVLAILGILYLQFFDVLSAAHLAPNHMALARRGLSPERASFLLVLILGALLFFSFRLSR